MKWPSFINEQNPLQVTHCLRSEDPDSLHFMKGNSEYLAVRTTQPYNSLDQLAREAYQGAPFLKVTEQGEDFTVLSVPDEVLTLRAIVMGTGQRKGRELASTFYQVGRTIGAILQHADIPRLHADDIAISRRSGNVLFVPPIAFEEPQAVAAPGNTCIQGSIADDLTKFSGHASEQLIEALSAGMTEYERPA